MRAFTEGEVKKNSVPDITENGNLSERRCNLWIMKPVGLSRGRGSKIILEYMTCMYEKKRKIFRSNNFILFQE